MQVRTVVDTWGSSIEHSINRHCLSPVSIHRNPHTYTHSSQPSHRKQRRKSLKSIVISLSPMYSIPIPARHANSNRSEGSHARQLPAKQFKLSQPAIQYPISPYTTILIIPIIPCKAVVSLAAWSPSPCIIIVKKSRVV